MAGLLKNGENTIRIDVANLAVNSMAARHILDYRQEYADLIAQFGDRFQPQDMNQIKPIPCGLFRPIRLIAAP